ncbi:MAG: lysyl oxidase family protein [Candidatus Limnocylindria bacterium]
MNSHRFVRLALATAVIASALIGGSVASADSTTELRPDLAMLAPRDFSVEHGARGVRRLRFDTIVVNVGAGPFDVYGVPNSATPGSYDVTQRIRDTASGGWTAYPTRATMFFAGDGHNHWHVRELQHWTLASVNSPANVLRRGAKTGFCFWDNYAYPGTTPVYYYPTTTSACATDGAGNVPMGLSVGWGDEYPSNIGLQYIDITGLAYGDYVLTIAADPLAQFVESNDTNNSNWARIRIRKNGVTLLAQGAQPPQP